MATDNGNLWINPIGGMGDTLMLSGVLKLASEHRPQCRYNLVRRTGYGAILDGHPAVETIGDPPPQAAIIQSDYWNAEEIGPGRQRAFQILARMFGLPTPVPENLFLPGELPDISYWRETVPWRKLNIAISPTSVSPRKEMPRPWWAELVQTLVGRGAFVAQLGRAHEPYVRGGYSLLGLTTLREAVALLAEFDLVITCDNFLMHAAHLARRPAVVLWGPTDHQVYGYPGHIHLQAMPCDEFATHCIGPLRPQIYHTNCHRSVAHCMTQITLERVLSACEDACRLPIRAEDGKEQT